MNLYFLTPQSASASGPFLEIGSQVFSLTTASSADWNYPPYTCISFAWGREKEPSPLDKEQMISKRAVPVLATLTEIINKDSGAMDKAAFETVWMDTFCIPTEADAREVYLRSMGEIYAHATQVVVVLAADTRPLLQAIRDNKEIDHKGLLLLESDEWVTRAWTYQEIVNSGRIYFIAEGETEAPVFGADFFDAVAKAIHAFGEGSEKDSYTLLEEYPSLSSFEAVVLDWRIMDYQKRSAYQVITNMCYRQSDLPNGLVYAMLGCIADDQRSPDRRAAIPAIELFMQICEAKGDFSFIYTTAPRGKEKNKNWRPDAELLKPVLPWLYCWGEGQAGTLHADYLELKNVCLYEPAPISGESLKTLMGVMSNHQPVTEDSYGIPYIWQQLNKIGFEGCGQYLELEHGYFFTIDHLPVTDNLMAVVATGVCWTFGAPGILVEKKVEGPYPFVGTGVFIGKTASSKLSVSII